MQHEVKVNVPEIATKPAAVFLRFRQTCSHCSASPKEILWSKNPLEQTRAL
jgi:hypothetical protein